MPLFFQVQNCRRVSYADFQAAARTASQPMLMQATLEGTLFTFVKDCTAMGRLIAYRTDNPNGDAEFYVA